MFSEDDELPDIEEGDEEVGNTGLLDSFNDEEEVTAPPVISPPVLDVKALADTLAGALSSSTKAQSDSLESLANRVIGSLGNKETPKLTKEQVLAKNRAIQAQFMDDSGDFDLEEAIRSMVAPSIRAEIERTVKGIEPLANASLSSTGEDVVERFKSRAFKDLPDKLREKAEAEVDKIITPAHFAQLAGLSAAQRRSELEIVQERVEGRLYAASKKARGSRNVTGGSDASGSKSNSDSAFYSLPKGSQLKVLNFAKALAKQRGLSPDVDAKAYNKYVKECVADQLGDE
jgi:hypothetical protein